MPCFSSLRVAGTLAFCCLASFASSMIVISNLPGNDLYQTSITPAHAQAVGFKVDAAGPYALQKVRLRLAVAPDSEPIIQLRRHGSNGLPENILYTFSNPTFYNGVRTYEFTGNANVNASTIYWITISSSRFGEPFDLKGSDPPQTPTGVWTHAGSADYVAKAGKWTSVSSIPSYSIEATLVPEPGTMIALGAGLAALAVRRRRNR